MSVRTLERAIAAGAVVGFVGERPTVVQVGASPHHVAFIGNTLVVAVSGTGEAVFVEGGQVVARARLSEGLHGVAIVELAGPLGERRPSPGGSARRSSLRLVSARTESRHRVSSRDLQQSTIQDRYHRADGFRGAGAA